MSESAIRKLQHRFIIVSMTALAITMLMIAGFLYIGTMVINRQVIHHTLEYIVENDGKLVVWSESNEESREGIDQYLNIIEQIFSTTSEYQSQEFQYRTRYFAVLVDKNDEIISTQTGHIHSIEDSEAVEYAYLALNSKNDFGRIDSYYYMVGEKEDHTIIVYLDSSSMLYSNQRLLYLALILIGFGMIVAFCIVRILSKKVIQNELRNAELQKQFMTNISHELKTPLAVIRANAEMSEMINGKDEWNESTVRQVERMDALIKNLVQISKADENRMKNITDDINVSQAMNETVDNFRSLATSNQKTLETKIEDNITYRADDSSLRQLCGLLLDNAIKYCDDNGTIIVELYKKNRSVNLIVSNDYAEGKNVDYTQFFERFYREDQSHNVDRGGFGIGLSIAENIVDQYHGEIKATWKNGRIFFHCILK